MKGLASEQDNERQATGREEEVATTHQPPQLSVTCCMVRLVIFIKLETERVEKVMVGQGDFHVRGSQEPAQWYIGQVGKLWSQHFFQLFYSL